MRIDDRLAWGLMWTQVIPAKSWRTMAERLTVESLVRVDRLGLLV